MIPKELGPWKIGQELGRGEFSSVYECKRAGEEHVWAMKLSPFVAPPLKTKEKKEQTSCRLLGWENQIYSLHLKDHPCFPVRPLKDAYASDCKGWRYLVMERFDGGTLKDRMTEGSDFSKATVFSIGIRLISALRQLHSRQFLFRDLKPENVMTLSDDSDGRGVVLVDYGACTKYVDSKGDHFTDGGQPVGTPNFMSMHVLERGPPGRRDDMESLGYLLGWLLNGGDLPWSSAKSEDEILRLKRDSSVAMQMCSGSKELNDYMKHIRALELEQAPNYDGMTQLFLRAGGTSTGPISFDQISPKMSSRDGKAAKKKEHASSYDKGSKKKERLSLEDVFSQDDPLMKKSSKARYDQVVSGGRKASSQSDTSLMEEEIEEEKERPSKKTRRKSSNDEETIPVSKRMSSRTNRGLKNQDAKPVELDVPKRRTQMRNSKSPEDTMKMNGRAKREEKESGRRRSSLTDEREADKKKSRASNEEEVRVQPGRSAKSMLVQAGFFLSAAAILYSSTVHNSS